MTESQTWTRVGITSLGPLRAVRVARRLLLLQQAVPVPEPVQALLLVRARRGLPVSACACCQSQ